MARLRPGPAAMRGLGLLARVGPMPLDAWALAMGWGERTAYYHARVLTQAGWLERCPRVRGEGVLLYASRAGARLEAVKTVPVMRPPAAHTWPHLDACAWTAAWLTVRGRELMGARQILASSFWRGELRWKEHGETRRRGHRPDLVGRLPDGRLMPIEVELTEKSTARLKSILGLFGQWLSEGKVPALMYVTASQELADRVSEHAKPFGLADERGTLRIELLETVRERVQATGGASLATAPGAGVGQQ